MPLNMDTDFLNNIQLLLNNYNDSPFTSQCIAACLLTHDPTGAIARLDRVLDAVASSHDTGFTAATAHLIARVSAASTALPRRISGNPALAGLLGDLDDPFSPRLDRTYYMAYLDAAAPGDSHSGTLRNIHLRNTAQLCRICARNADPENTITGINSELSLLAEATVETVLAEVYRTMIGRLEIESPLPHALTVLGLGKLGGGELNVSSDIDLIYLCGDEERSWGRYNTLSFHGMLTERLTRALSEPTEAGFLYRVDTRLRADGLVGPLVRTFREYSRYLEMRGEAWERQMLLKARPIAGDIAAGERSSARSNGSYTRKASPGARTAKWSRSRTASRPV